MATILVVDDDKNTLKYFTSLLKAEHFDVLSAENGEEALRLLAGRKVDLAVLDVMMPGMDGYELTEAIREIDGALPILMCSAKQLVADRNKGFLSGIDDYLTKPFDSQELILRIKALLRRSKIAAEGRIVIGDTVIDRDKLTVTGHGEVQELPQKEFLLLYKLLSYPGQVFTRLQLMDEIWGFDSESGSETVTVHVGRLRKRFEGWDEFEIVSVRGLGYKAVKKDRRRDGQ